jgi:hypothetical protein
VSPTERTARTLFSAHLVGRGAGAPRISQHQTRADSDENLIALCAACHVGARRLAHEHQRGMIPFPPGRLQGSRIAGLNRAPNYPFCWHSLCGLF